MIEMPRVVADFIDVWCDHRDQTVVLLKINRKIGGGLLANLRQRFGVFFTIDGNANHIGTRILHQLHERNGRFNILRLGRCH